MATTETRIDCGERLDIGAADALHGELAGALDAGRPVSLDISALERIDTAGTQLLLAFVREAGSKEIPVHWHGDPAPLREAAQQLGVAPELGLPD